MRASHKTVLLILSLFVCISAQASNHRAFYEIPAGNDSINSIFNIVKMPSVQVTEITAQKSNMMYTLPLELTGVKNSFEFSGSIGSELTYEGNTMLCSDEDPIYWICKVKFKDLAMDDNLAKQLLKNQFQGLELNARLQLQAKFSTDPVGIIYIEKAIEAPSRSCIY